MCGHSNDWDVPACRPFPSPNGRSNLKTVHIRHLDVQQHHIKGFFLKSRQRFSAIACD